MFEENNIGIIIGIIFLVAVVLICILIPIIATIILGVAIANLLQLQGIVWWSFLIIFYLIVQTIIGLGAKITTINLKDN